MFRSFDLLSIPPGIVSVTGSGGKTSFLRYLSKRLEGTVILSTSTRIYPFPEYPLITASGEAGLRQIRSTLALQRVVCLGTPNENGKLSAPEYSFTDLARLADHVLVEADGAAGLPLKAHRSFEPVIPEGTALRICIAGISGCGQPISKVCHCPGLFSKLAEADPEDPARVELIARVLNAEQNGDLYFINQTDLPGGREKALRLSDLLDRPAFAGSLKEQQFLY